MKNYIISLTIILAMLYVILINNAIISKDIRRDEEKRQLNQAVRSAIQQLQINPTYEIDNNDEFVAEFISVFLSGISSDSDIKINVINADAVNGFLDVMITETFQYQNGKEGTISIRKATIIDEFIQTK